MVNSADHEFNFLAAKQGEIYILIDSIPLRFTRTGDHTLEVTQSAWLRLAEAEDLPNRPVIGIQKRLSFRNPHYFA